jgi:hypothetical protein
MFSRATVRALACKPNCSTARLGEALADYSFQEAKTDNLANIELTSVGHASGYLSSGELLGYNLATTDSLFAGLPESRSRGHFELERAHPSHAQSREHCRASYVHFDCNLRSCSRLGRQRHLRT